MNLEQLQALFRSLTEKAKELREKTEPTDEDVAALKANTEERAKVRAQIDTIMEADKLDEFFNHPINIPKKSLQQRNQVEDQPIYRSKFPLGEQMVDIRKATVGGPGAEASRARLQQVYNRAKDQQEKRAAGTGGMVEAVGSDGGFLLQGETAFDFVTNGFNNDFLLSKTSKRTTSNQFVDLVDVNETSRADGSRGGGVQVYTDAELALMIQSKTEFKKTRIEPKRLTGLYYASDELLDDAPMLEGEMGSLFEDEFSFKMQNLILRGSGAGEALGILNAPSLVTQTKESGQIASTIVSENIINMKSRITLRNLSGLTWLINQDVEPALYTMTWPVGTGGVMSKLYIPAGVGVNQASQMGSMLGIPVVPVEQASTLGTVGDITLANWSKYWTATKGGLQTASSIHLKFDYNQTTFRFVLFFDGQPKSASAITPYQGTNTVSPFVTLQTRP